MFRPSQPSEGTPFGYRDICPINRESYGPDHSSLSAEAKNRWILYLNSLRPQDARNLNLLTCVLYICSSLGGLEVACWPFVSKFAGSNPAEAVGFFRAKKSSARLPSEGK